jgi:hypothetical protein
MKRRERILKHTVCFLFLYFISVGNSIVYASAAEDRRWSFTFYNHSIVDGLNEISEASGVEILLNGEADLKPITKSYNDYTIENMIADIFQGENLVALFSYNKQQLAIVKIWILPKSVFKNTAYKSVSANKNPKSTVIPSQEYKEAAKRSKQLQLTIKEGTKNIEKDSDNRTNNSAHYVNFIGQNSVSSVLEEDKTVDIPEVPNTLRGLEAPPMPPGISL